jgi:hypothetical protein
LKNKTELNAKNERKVFIFERRMREILKMKSCDIKAFEDKRLKLDEKI